MVEIRVVPAYPSTANRWEHMRQRYIGAADIRLIYIYYTTWSIIIFDMLMFLMWVFSLFVIFVLLGIPVFVNLQSSRCRYPRTNCCLIHHRVGQGDLVQRFGKGIHQLFQGNLGLMLGWCKRNGWNSELVGFLLQYVNSKKQSDTSSHGRGTFKNRMAKHQDLLMTVKPYVDDIARNPHILTFSHAIQLHSRKTDHEGFADK